MAEKLTPKQKAFADAFIECGNKAEAARRAGYSAKSARDIGEENSAKPHIAAYIAQRMNAQEEARVASADEVLRFYTEVMRGNVKDQFGLDASLADRLNAGRELMKRHAAAESNKPKDAPRIIKRRPDE